MSATSRTASKLSKIVEANVIATHAYEVLMATKTGKGDPKCWSANGLSNDELKALVAHQKSLLRKSSKAILAWAEGRKSRFDPAKDVEPLLAAPLKLSEKLPVNVYTQYFQGKTGGTRVQVRAIASLLQMMLEVHRDADVVHELYKFYVALKLPVHVGQFGLPDTREYFLEVGNELSPRMCVSPFDTTAAGLQITGRKMMGWGRRYTHERDRRTLAYELLNEPEINALLPKIKIGAMPSQRIAAIGHSFTAELVWTSPSAFVPIVKEMLEMHNPGVQTRQWCHGGLSASRAEKMFYEKALAWEPNKVLLVVAMRSDKDVEAMERMANGFAKAGAQVMMFDHMDPPVPGAKEPAWRKGLVERTGMTFIEVGELLAASPDKDKFLCLDNIHMTEPYHRLMAKEWFKFLVGARGAKLTE